MSRLLQLLLAAKSERALHSRIGSWRLAVTEALGPWESSLPLPWHTNNLLGSIQWVELGTLLITLTL